MVARRPAVPGSRVRARVGALRPEAPSVFPVRDALSIHYAAWRRVLLRKGLPDAAGEAFSQ